MEKNEEMELSDEAKEQVVTFLKEMEELQRNNPQAFNELLNSMGLDENPATGNSMNRENIIEAISQMRDQKEGISGLELPGGIGTLSSDGIKNKMKGIQITPEPGFTIKTRREDDSKVFINLCQHAELAVPALKKRLNDDGEEVEGMNIPLSVGPAKEGKDKSGVSCTIYDVIVNPQVLQDVLGDSTGKHRDFICQLAIQSIEQKYKMNLDKRYKLPKIRYLGEITSQQIQDRKNMPKIEEIEVKGSSTSSKSSQSKKIDKAEVKPTIKEPDRPVSYTLHWKYDDNKEVLFEDNAPLVQEYQMKIATSNLTHPNPSSKVYSEPLVPSDDGVKSFVFRALVDVKVVNDPKQISLNVSPFRFDLKLPGYLPCNFFFPCAMSVTSPSSVKSILHRLPGYTQVIELVVMIPVDLTPWGALPDPGSKPWLVAEALKGEESSTTALSKVAQSLNETAEYPEEKFHIRLPDDVDKYTGVKYSADHTDEFPEDKFHRQDAVSQYIIEQREKDIKAKWEKHEKEKAERKNDPNVEYIDVEDFKPGGKYGPQPLALSSNDSESNAHDDLQRASKIIASSSTIERDGNESKSSQNNGISLSSELWTQLLD